MTISRQQGFRLCSRSILMAILGLGFLVWTPVSAVAETNAPNAEVEAFIKADSLHDSNARFLNVYESLDGDREKIVKALMHHGFTCATIKGDALSKKHPDFRCSLMVCRPLRLGHKFVSGFISHLPVDKEIGQERSGDRVWFYRRKTDRIVGAAVHYSFPFTPTFFCPGKAGREKRQKEFYLRKPLRWELIK